MWNLNVFHKINFIPTLIPTLRENMYDMAFLYMYILLNDYNNQAN